MIVGDVLLIEFEAAEIHVIGYVCPGVSLLFISIYGTTFSTVGHSYCPRPWWILATAEMF